MEFDLFVRTRLAALLGFARVMTADRSLAEDLVQEVLLRAQSRWTRIEAMSHADAYVRRMLINEYLSWHRRSRPVTMAQVPERSSSPDHAEQVADHDQLTRELARLPARQRTCLALRYYVGLSDADIARELGCGESTVRSHMTRGLQALRVEMSDDERVR